jgi:hypothetical protein
MRLNKSPSVARVPRVTTIGLASGQMTTHEINATVPHLLIIRQATEIYFLILKDDQAALPSSVFLLNHWDTNDEVIPCTTVDPKITALVAVQRNSY